MRRENRYRSFFIVAGAVVIWLGVKLLLAAFSAAAAIAGAAAVFAGMRMITRSGSR